MKLFPTAQQLSQWTANATHYGTLIPVIGIVAALFQKGMSHYLNGRSDTPTPFSNYLSTKSVKLIDQELLWSIVPLFGAFKIISLRSTHQIDQENKGKFQDHLSKWQKGQSFLAGGKLKDAENEFNSSIFLQNWRSPIDPFLSYAPGQSLLKRIGYDRAITQILLIVGDEKTDHLANVFPITEFDFSEEVGLGLHFGRRSELPQEIREKCLSVDIECLPNNHPSKGKVYFEQAKLRGYQEGAPITDGHIAIALHMAGMWRYPSGGFAFELFDFYQKKGSLDIAHDWASFWYDHISIKDAEQLLKIARFFCSYEGGIEKATNLYRQLQAIKGYETVGKFNLELTHFLRIKKTYQQVLKMGQSVCFPDRLPEDQNRIEFLTQRAVYCLIPTKHETERAKICELIGDLSQIPAEKYFWYKKARDLGNMGITQSKTVPLIQKHPGIGQSDFLFMED